MRTAMAPIPIDPLAWCLFSLRDILSRCLCLLFLLAALERAEAHNGAVAIAVPVAGITIDGDFSDWPAEMRRYPILLPEGGVRPKGTEDFQGSFRIGYHAEEHALYVAVEGQDESTVIDTTAGVEWGGTQDGCEVFVELGHREESTPPAIYEVWGNTRRVEGIGKLEEVKVEVQREAGWHRYEWRLDMSRIHEGQVYLHPRMVVGFDVALWDKDADGSGSWMAWGRGVDKHQRSDRLGDLVLTEQGEEAGKLQGQASWEGTEEGISHGKVRVQSLATEKLWVQAETDRQGHYAVEVPEGQYQIAISGFREKGEDRTIAVQAGQVAEVGLAVKLPTGLVQPAGLGRGHWQSVGVAEGLSSLWIRRILQDRAGNLWVAALDGLSRYDGQQWTPFTTKDGLASNAATFVLEDRQGNLWFGTYKGVSRYDGQQWTTFTTKDGLASNGVEYMLEDQKGNLWVGSYGGVSRYDGQQWTPFATGLLNNMVRCMAEDQQGNLWFGGGGGTFSGGGGLSRYDGQTLKVFTTADGLATDYVIDLAVDREGNLWAGTFSGGGVSRYDGQQFKNFTTQDGLPSNNVVSILEDREGTLWFGTTDAGVCRYDGQRWTTFTTEDGLAHDHVLSILEDREGSLWFGTFGGGLSRYDEQVKTFTMQDGLAQKGVMAIAEDQQGNLWVANGDWMAGKGVSRYDGQQWATFTTQDGLADNQVRSILGDSQGKVWFGTDGQGVSRYDGQRFETFTTEEGLASNWVNAIAEDHEGNLWFGTQEGVSRYDGQRWTTFTTEEGLASNWVNAIAEDREGNLWFGTAGGLSRYDGQRWTTFTVEDGLPINWVKAILQDQRGTLWVGTGEERWAVSGGLSRYEGQRFETFTATEGLASNRVVSLAEDKEGTLWLGTGGGVSRYDGRVFQHLFRQDGLAHDAAHQVLQTRNGDIWIATEGGLTRYRPRSALPPPIRIKDVVADHHYGPAAEIRLPSSQKLLTFEFAGLSFKTRPGQMAYVYKLEGHDPDWQVTRQNRVEYTDLPVGNYTFQVKAVDRDLNYSAQPATVAVEVFYQPITSPVRLAEVHLQDLFASFYKTYNTQPLGSVRVINDSPDSVAATLSLFIPKWMEQSSEQSLHLAPQSSQQVEVKALLDEQVLTLREVVPVQAEVSLAVASGEQSIAVKEKEEVLLHGRGALTWEGVGKAATFITPDDPAVSAFARSTLVAFEEQTKGLGKPCRNLLRAMVLLEALKQHGVRYIPDANTPYGKVSADRSVVDHISYPAEVLQQKAGDCDDLTVLYGALLENAGVSTALVDAPGHIFLLFDSGVSRQEVYKLSVEEKLYVVRGDRVWVPVEVTLVGEGFVAAWRAGAEELVKIKGERERVVDTQVAWEMYAPASPVFAEKVSVPSREETQEGVRTQYATLEQQVDAYIEQTYLYPLKTHPDNAALWSELARVYVALGKYEAVIQSAYDRLIERGGSDVGLLNQLGIAYFLKGDVRQAAYSFKQAAELAPEDAGIRRNLHKAMEALGKGEGLKGKPPAEVAGTEELGTEEVSASKAGQVEMDEDSFYWGE